MIRCSRKGSLSNQDGEGNENGKNAIGLISKTTTLHVQHVCLYIYLPSLHDYNVKVTNFTFCRGREHKTTAFFFFSWTFDAVHWNSTPKKFANIWRKKRDKITAIKIETARANWLFKWRFRSRRRRCGLSSLISQKVEFHLLSYQNLRKRFVNGKPSVYLRLARYTSLPLDIKPCFQDKPSKKS